MSPETYFQCARDIAVQALQVWEPSDVVMECMECIFMPSEEIRRLALRDAENAYYGHERIATYQPTHVPGGAVKRDIHGAKSAAAGAVVMTLWRERPSESNLRHIMRLVGSALHRASPTVRSQIDRTFEETCEKLISDAASRPE